MSTIASAERPDTITLLQRLFRDFMELDQDRVFLYNQKLPEPPDEGIFLVISLIPGGQPFAVNVRNANIKKTPQGCWVEDIQPFVPPPPNQGLRGRPGPLTMRPASPVNVGDVLGEIISTNMQEHYKVLIASYSREAYTRRYEPILALSSNIGQVMQERYGFRIAKMPDVPPQDRSFLDQTGMLTRYEIPFNVLTATEIIKPIPSFSEFQTPVIVSQT